MTCSRGQKGGSLFVSRRTKFDEIRLGSSFKEFRLNWQAVAFLVLIAIHVADSCGVDPSSSQAIKASGCHVSGCSVPGK